MFKTIFKFISIITICLELRGLEEPTSKLIIARREFLKRRLFSQIDQKFMKREDNTSIKHLIITLITLFCVGVRPSPLFCNVEMLNIF